jgi:hypothetical protein
MTWKHCMVSCCAGIVLGAIGAWKVLPQPVRIETKTEVIERVVTRTAWAYTTSKDTKTKERRNVVVVERHLPTGEVSITTSDRTVVDAESKEISSTVGAATVETERKEKSSTVSEPKQNKWYLGLSWRAYPEGSLVPSDIEAKYRVVGGIWVGASIGLDQGKHFVAKATLGATF